MMLEMLALPEKAHVANQGKEESGRSLNGRSLMGTLPGGSGPSRMLRAPQAPSTLPRLASCPHSPRWALNSTILGTESPTPKQCSEFILDAREGHRETSAKPSHWLGPSFSIQEVGCWISGIPQGPRFWSAPLPAPRAASAVSSGLLMGNPRKK